MELSKEVHKETGVKIYKRLDPETFVFEFSEPLTTEDFCRALVDDEGGLIEEISQQTAASLAEVDGLASIFPMLATFFDPDIQYTDKTEEVERWAAMTEEFVKELIDSQPFRPHETTIILALLGFRIGEGGKSLLFRPSIPALVKQGANRTLVTRRAMLLDKFPSEFMYIFCKPTWDNNNRYEEYLKYLRTFLNEDPQLLLSGFEDRQVIEFISRFLTGVESRDIYQINQEPLPSYEQLLAAENPMLQLGEVRSESILQDTIVLIDSTRDTYLDTKGDEDALYEYFDVARGSLQHLHRIIQHPSFSNDPGFTQEVINNSLGDMGLSVVDGCLYFNPKVIELMRRVENPNELIRWYGELGTEYPLDNRGLSIELARTRQHFEKHFGKPQRTLYEYAQGVIGIAERIPSLNYAEIRESRPLLSITGEQSRELLESLQMVDIGSKLGYERGDESSVLEFVDDLLSAHPDLFRKAIDVSILRLDGLNDDVDAVIRDFRGFIESEGEWGYIGWLRDYIKRALEDESIDAEHAAAMVGISFDKFGTLCFDPTISLLACFANSDDKRELVRDFALGQNSVEDILVILEESPEVRMSNLYRLYGPQGNWGRYLSSL
jgi:hypothetical protein